MITLSMNLRIIWLIIRWICVIYLFIAVIVLIVMIFTAQQSIVRQQVSTLSLFSFSIELFCSSFVQSCLLQMWLESIQGPGLSIPCSDETCRYQFHRFAASGQLPLWETVSNTIQQTGARREVQSCLWTNEILKLDHFSCSWYFYVLLLRCNSVVPNKEIFYFRYFPV